MPGHEADRILDIGYKKELKQMRKEIEMWKYTNKKKEEGRYGKEIISVKMNEKNFGITR